MSDSPSSDPIPAQQVTSEPTPVIETIPPESGAESAPQQTTPEPAPTEPPPPPPPFWASRKYIKRSFCFPFGGAEIQGNFFDLGNGQIDVDGLYGSQEFESTDHLVRLAAPTHEAAQTLVSKIRRLAQTQRISDKD